MLTKKQKLITLGMTLFPTLLFAQEDVFVSKLTTIFNYVAYTVGFVLVAYAIMFSIFRFINGDKAGLINGFYIGLAGVGLTFITEFLNRFIFT